MKSFILSVALVTLTFVSAVVFPVSHHNETFAARSSMQAQATDSSVNIGEWRRTAQGWERSTYWNSPPAAASPIDWEAWAAIHPALLAIFLLLVSLLALQSATPSPEPVRRQTR